MNCENILSLIEKLADGECEPSEKDQAEAHLKSCESCRAHLRFLNALPVAARQAPLPEPPEMYWEVLPRKIVARIEERSGKTSRAQRGGWAALLTPLRLRWLGAAAAAVLVVMVGLEVFTLYRLDGPSEPTALSAPDALTEPERPEAESPTPSNQPALDSSPQVVLKRAKPLPEEEESLSSAGAFADEEPRESQDPGSAGLATPPEKKAPELPAVASPPPPAAVDRLEVAGEPASPRARALVQREAQFVAGGELAVEESVSAETSERALPAPPGVQEEPSLGRMEADRADVADQQAMKSSLPREPARELGTRASFRSLSIYGKSEVELETERRELREQLIRAPKGDELVDIRYRLAVRSIRLFDLRNTAQNYEQAMEDAAAYLEIASDQEGELIRRERDRIKK